MYEFVERFLYNTTVELHSRKPCWQWSKSSLLQHLFYIVLRYLKVWSSCIFPKSAYIPIPEYLFQCIRLSLFNHSGYEYIFFYSVSLARIYQDDVNWTYRPAWRALYYVTVISNVVGVPLEINICVRVFVCILQRSNISNGIYYITCNIKYVPCY